MKTVIYHANASLANKFEPSTYERLIDGLRKNVNAHGMPLVHLTIEGQPGLGDENYYYQGNPELIVWNRERFFLEFLRQAPDDIYWFAEPDYRIESRIPPLFTDLALLRRDDKVAITPSWRMASKSAIPFFEEALSYYPADSRLRAWDGDSDAYVKMWQVMGQPGLGTLTHNDVIIDLRSYPDYCSKSGKYTSQWKAFNKDQLLAKEHGVTNGSR